MGKEKTLSVEFYAFDSAEAKKKLKEKAAKEFPILTTAKDGKVTLRRELGWLKAEYNDTEFEVPVVKCDGDDDVHVTLALLAGKPDTFKVCRDCDKYKKGEVYEVNNLVPFSIEMARASARNSAVMKVITDGQEITLITLFGYNTESEKKRAYPLQVVAEGLKKVEG